MGTDFQVLEDFENASDKLKSVFESQLRRLLRHNSRSTALLLEVHDSACRYFDHAERFAHNFYLLEASKDGKWLPGLVDDCYKILKSILKYYTTIKVECKERKLDFDAFWPERYAYDDMQRLVARMLPESAQELCKAYTTIGLPVDGFYVEKSMFDQLTPSPHTARRVIRTRLQEQFKTSADLHGFIIDFFPEIASRLTPQMISTDVHNLLLQMVPSENIAAAMESISTMTLKTRGISSS